MADTKAAILRKWKILSRMTNEELEKVVYVNIFGTDEALHNLSQGALMITTDDEVFYKGPGHQLFGGSDEKQNMTKVDGLSGLNIKKIEVGNDFCVALTDDNNLYFWGGLTPEKIPDRAFICYNLFSGTPYCTGCGYNSGYGSISYQYLGSIDFAGVKLENGCAKCRRPPATCSLKDSAGKQVVKLVDFKEAAIRCTKCRGRCIPHEIWEREVNYCKWCHYLPQDATHYVPFDAILKPKLMGLGEINNVVDVACGVNFYVALTKKNDLILMGVIAGSNYEGFIYNPENVVVKAFSCGSNHVAVVSVQGDLYTCGQGDLGQLGYEWTPEMGHETLRRVPLDGKVLKVRCGYSSTVCLMADGSLMCFGSHMKLLSPGVLALNQNSSDFISKPARIMLTKKFTDIVHSSFTNIYFAKTDSLIFTWGRKADASRQPKLVLGEDNSLTALADLPATFTFKAPCSQQSTLSPHLDSELYGKKFLSDLTLKLSDGDFPAHRLILHTNSVYFRDTFGESDSENVLDMTHYNPEAYRCLLKYFYQVPPTDLNPTDLFDLYVLASSYKESAIAQEAFAKLKDSLNPDTVLPLLRKAKEVNCSEFLDECNAFIKSPEFKHILAEKVSEDLDKTLSLLEVFNVKK